MNFSLWENRTRRHSTAVVSPDDSSETNNDNRNGTAIEEGSDPATSRSESTSSSQQPLLNELLRSELLGENMDPIASSNLTGRSTGVGSRNPLRESGNYFRFQSPREVELENFHSSSSGPESIINSFSLNPMGSASSHLLLSAPQKRTRRIQKVPFKVLDAPALQDDFYLNLVDWSSLNVLAVGLGSCVYLWSACTSKVTKLCDLATSEDIVTSVSWAQRGVHLAVGTNKGEVQLWDTIKIKKVRTMTGHNARIGALSWSGPTMASGSRDRQIFLRDVRVQSQFTARLTAHKQEVCGLKWSFDEPANLASGGNDNKLLVWDVKNHSQPVHRFGDHTAAVKAITWSPHQHGLLASGGGTADRCIRFWNTLSGVGLSCVDTGSQVCNLAWSQNCNEIVSTHGYSLNQIVVWRYPSMSKVATLTGHTYRVLYLAMSPDGSTIVTGAGDETLRFWQIFPGPRSNDKNGANGLLFPFSPGSVIR
jgi:cell division cycle 20-like protein 1 (cofactor of APC complex)